MVFNPGTVLQKANSGLSLPSRHLTSVGRQIDVRLRRHNDVGFRLILKVCLTSKADVILTSKTDVILTSKTDVILTSEKQRHNDVGVRLILKVCLTSKTDVNLTC